MRLHPSDTEKINWKSLKVEVFLANHVRSELGENLSPQRGEGKMISVSVSI